MQTPDKSNRIINPDILTEIFCLLKVDPVLYPTAEPLKPMASPSKKTDQQLLSDPGKGYFTAHILKTL